MSLVPDYDSDSDGSDAPPPVPAVVAKSAPAKPRPQQHSAKHAGQKRIITVDLPARPDPTTPDAPVLENASDEDTNVKAPASKSIAAFLPAPKNRKKQTKTSDPAPPKSHNDAPQRTLGSTNSTPRIAISKPVARQAPPKSTPAPTPAIPSLFSFDAAPAPKLGSRGATTFQRAPPQPAGPSRPLNDPAEEQEVPHPQEPVSAPEPAAEPPAKKRRRDRYGDDVPDADAMIDFRVDDFYAQNLAANTITDDIRRPVKSVGSSRQQHQLGNLIRTAQQNEAGLQEKHAQLRRMQKEAGSKYGF